MERRFVLDEENNMIDLEGVFSIDNRAFNGTPWSTYEVYPYYKFINELNDKSKGDTNRKIGLFLALNIIPIESQWSKLFELESLEDLNPLFFEIFDIGHFVFDEIYLSKDHLSSEYDEYLFDMGNGNSSVIVKVHRYWEFVEYKVKEIALEIKEYSLYEKEQKEIAMKLDEEHRLIEDTLRPQVERLKEDRELFDLIMEASQGNENSMNILRFILP